MNALSSHRRLVAGACLLLIATLAAWFLVVSPKRADAARLDKELTAAHQRLGAARLEERSNREKQQRLPSLEALKRALPDEVAMSRIIRELNAVATATGLQFTSIVPGTLRSGQGFQVLPLSVEFEGGFSRTSSFLTRLRKQVEVRSGKTLTRANGRLYVIESIALSEGENGLPSLKTTLTLDAFVYAQPATLVDADPSTLPLAAGETR